MDYYVVIPAAGQGKRMNAGMNKQFIHLNGIPVIIHTLNVFESDSHCKGIVLVANKDEIEYFKELLAEHAITKVVELVEGGQERQHSVYNGLKVLNGADVVVLIHDGARPFIKQSIIHQLVKAVENYDSAVVAVPVKDTIKSVQNGVVEKTMERSSLWSVQTPQAFRLSLIMRAHRQAEKDNYLGTDDASLVEYIGNPVHIVMGDYQNIKLTTPEDLLYGEAILTNKNNQRGN